MPEQPPVPPAPPARGSLVREVLLYTAARLALVAVVALLLVLVGVPVVVALLMALVVSMPLSLFVLRTMRARVNAGVAEATERRQAERERLRSQLRGER